VLRAKECTLTPSSVVFILELAFKSSKEFGGASPTTILKIDSSKMNDFFHCCDLLDETQ
jgi:hypothetical protein